MENIFSFMIWSVIMKGLPSPFLFQSSVRALDPCTSAGVPGCHSDRLAYDVDHNECDLEVVFAEIIRKQFVNICIFGQPLSYPALVYHRILPYCALPKSNPVPIFWQPMFSTLPQLPTIAMGKQLLQHYFSNTIVRIANGREREFF